MYSSYPLIRPFSHVPLIRPDFRCIDMVKCYQIVPFKRGHLSYKVTFSLQNECLQKRGNTLYSFHSLWIFFLTKPDVKILSAVFSLVYLKFTWARLFNLQLNFNQWLKMITYGENLTKACNALFNLWLNGLIFNHGIGALLKHLTIGYQFKMAARQVLSMMPPIQNRKPRVFRAIELRANLIEIRSF